MKFDEIKIGDKVLDGKFIETIMNMTSNSIEVTRTARGENGVNCKQWFTMRDFEEKFKNCNNGKEEEIIKVAS